jgi:hypothetical protein
MQEQVNDKLRKFVSRRYINVVERYRIKVPIVYFPVQKGEADIRIVWSETETGVNDSVFAPNFFLPTLDTLIRRLPNDAWLGDFDVGEQFHNFELHYKHQPFHGVLFPEELWAEFGGEAGMMSRLPMGFRPSPYLAGRAQTRALEIAKGDPSVEGNPFGFTEVKLNLPMSPNFDPTQPRVQKLNRDGLPAGDVLMYVDDGRPIGRTEPHANACMRQICSRLEYLGIQDAKRKRRPVSQRAGAWAGGVVFTDKGVPRKFLSQDRWDRLRGYLWWIRDHLEDPLGLDRREFLRARGFIVYASMTYTFAVPFLKGIHLTVDAWRSDRDAEGWKIRPVATSGVVSQSGSLDGREDWLDDGVTEDHEFVSPDMIEPFDDTEVCSPPRPEAKHEGEGLRPSTTTQVPTTCLPVPRLTSDVDTLLKLFSGTSPIMIPIRPTRLVSLVYGFGDASGEGFGSAFSLGRSSGSLFGKMRVRRGFWCTSISEEASNYREFHNLLDAVEDLATTGDLEGAEVYLFTDNATSEAIFYSGTTDSPKLFGLMIDLRVLALQVGFDLRLIHIAGTRMISQGTDGLSRGELQLGSLLDTSTQVVPLHLDPITRTKGGLSTWVWDWTGLDAKLLPVATPIDWMHQAHLPGSWIWTLPPAAALYALEELALARLKRGESVGAIVLIPSLMKPEWFRRFVRTVDIYFAIPVGCPCWPADMHESLTVGLVFPLLRCEPWHWRRVPFMVGLGRALSAMHKTDYDAARDFLRKFWAARARAACLPKCVVRPLLLQPNYHPFLSLSK